MKKHYLIGFAILFYFACPAQNYLDFLSKVVKHLNSLKSYSVQVSYKMYLDQNLETVFQSRTISIEYFNNCIYSRYSNGVSLIYNSLYQLTIDDRNKTILAKKSGNLQIDHDGMAMKKLFEEITTNAKTYKSIRKIKSSQTRTSFELICQPNDPVESIIIEFDNKLDMISSVTTYYRDKLKIKELKNEKHSVCIYAEYKNFTKDINYQKDYFSEKKFISINGTQITTIGKYKNYKLEILTD